MGGCPGLEQLLVKFPALTRTISPSPICSGLQDISIHNWAIGCSGHIGEPFLVLMPPEVPQCGFSALTPRLPPFHTPLCRCLWSHRHLSLGHCRCRPLASGVWPPPQGVCSPRLLRSETTPTRVVRPCHRSAHSPHVPHPTQSGWRALAWAPFSLRPSCALCIFQ